LSSPIAQRPQGMGWPIGFEPILRDSQSRVLPLHHSHHEERLPGTAAQPLSGIASDALGGDDRARTGGLSPDKRVLFASELRPRD
jgi:hypothetical protein